MKTASITLACCLILATTVLADPGWIRRAPMESRTGNYGMSTNPDGIVGDYIVQFGASAHEVDFYDPETLAFVKTIKSSDHALDWDGLVPGVAASAGAEIRPITQYGMFGHLSGSKFIVTDYVLVYEIGTGALEYPDLVDAGMVVYTAIIDVETNVMQDSHAFHVAYTPYHGLASTIAYQDEENNVIFYYTDCDPRDSGCEGWYAAVNLATTGPVFISGGSYTETDVIEGPNAEKSFRYDVVNDPLGKMEEWGNPRAVIWTTGFSYDFLLNDEDRVYTPFVICFKIDSAGVASIVYVKKFPAALNVDTERVSTSIGAGDTSDSFVLYLHHAQANEKRVSTEFWLMRKTMDSAELLADNKAYYSSYWVSTSFRNKEPVVTGSLASGDMKVLIPSFFSGSEESLPAPITAVVESGKIVMNKYPGINCEKATQVSFNTPNGCDHIGGTPLYTQGTVTRVFNGLSAYDFIDGPFGHGVVKVCGADGDCDLFLYEYSKNVWSVLEYNDDVAAFGGLGFGALVVLGVAGGAAGYRARTNKGKAAESKHSPLESAPSESQGAPLPSKRPAPGGGRGSLGSKGSRGSKRNSGAARSGGSRRSKGSKRASSAGKRSSTGSRRSKGSVRSKGSNRAPADPAPVAE